MLSHKSFCVAFFSLRLREFMKQIYSFHLFRYILIKYFYYNLIFNFTDIFIFKYVIQNSVTFSYTIRSLYNLRLRLFRRYYTKTR